MLKDRFGRVIPTKKAWNGKTEYNFENQGIRTVIDLENSSPNIFFTGEHCEFISLSDIRNIRYEETNLGFFGKLENKVVGKIKFETKTDIYSKKEWEISVLRSESQYVNEILSWINTFLKPYIDSEKQREEELSHWDYWNLHVVGVRYSNPDGTERQKIINKFIRSGEQIKSIEFEKYIWEEKDAFYVKLNGKIVGVVPREDNEFCLKHIAKTPVLVDYEFYKGKGTDSHGQKNVTYHIERNKKGVICLLTALIVARTSELLRFSHHDS